MEGIRSDLFGLLFAGSQGSQASAVGVVSPSVLGSVLGFDGDTDAQQRSDGGSPLGYLGSGMLADVVL